MPRGYCRALQDVPVLYRLHLGTVDDLLALRKDVVAAQGSPGDEGAMGRARLLTYKAQLLRLSAAADPLAGRAALACCREAIDILETPGHQPEDAFQADDLACARLWCETFGGLPPSPLCSVQIPPETDSKLLHTRDWRF